MITGRPQRHGLDYFPLAVDFFDDPKIRALSAEFGCKGEITAIKLLCAVYRKGYFIRWNDRTQVEMLGVLPGMSHGLLLQVVNRLVKWDFFDKDLFNSANVLTSKTIQKIYFHAIKRRKPSENLPYLLIPPDELMCAKKDFMYAESHFMYAESQQSNKRELRNTLNSNKVSTIVEPLSAEPTPDDSNKEDEIDFKSFLQFFNETVSGCAIPAIKILSDRRKAMLRARLKEYDKQALAEVVRKAADSKFLNGGSDKPFIANFDWIFRPNNFPKVLEGNYDNRTSSNYGQHEQPRRTIYQTQQLANISAAEQDVMESIRKTIGGTEGIPKELPVNW